MFRRLWKLIKDFISTPKLKDISPNFVQPYPWERGVMGDPLLIHQTAEDRHREDMRALALAEFELQKDSMQKNLKLQHRTVIVALIAVFVAIFSSVVAMVVSFYSEPPNVNVEVYEQETIQTTN